MSSAAENMSALDIVAADSSISSNTFAVATASLDAAIAQGVSTAAVIAQDVTATHGSSSWIGLFVRLILSGLHVVSIVLYFVLKAATFSLPTLLYTLFSTTLTVTMNATTL